MDEQNEYAAAMDVLRIFRNTPEHLPVAADADEIRAVANRIREAIDAAVAEALEGPTVPRLAETCDACEKKGAAEERAALIKDFCSPRDLHFDEHICPETIKAWVEERRAKK